VTSSATQPPESADDLERLRHARGEGWQWHRIQEEPCPQCDHNPAGMDPEVLAALILELIAAWREFLVEADEEYLRHIPEPGVFSPIQYGAHVNGMLRVAGDRVKLGREQENPVVPIFNPPQEEWAAYNELEVEVLIADLEANARRLTDMLDALDDSEWSRTVINDRGPYGVYSFTLAGIARNAAHESHHHLLDAKGTLHADSSS
jgi:hypothetical protein